ncbi:hypothetical protein AVEN_208166-1, partial [Araneus ventricosus]
LTEPWLDSYGYQEDVGRRRGHRSNRSSDDRTGREQDGSGCSRSSPPSTTSVNLTSLLCAAEATIREPASSDPVTRCLQLNELTKQLKRLRGTIPLIMCDADVYVQLDNGHFLSTKDSLMDVFRHAIDALVSDIALFGICPIDKCNISEIKYKNFEEKLNNGSNSKRSVIDSSNIMNDSSTLITCGGFSSLGPQAPPSENLTN